VTKKQRHILKKALAGLEKTKLIDLLLNQAERLEKLEREVERLRGELTTALRANKRQAAPFGKAKKEIKPRRSGRKSGHKGSYRRPSAEPNEEEESPLDCCPRCGGPVQQIEPVDQIIEEIPPIEPRVVRLRTYRGQCPCCGPVQSSHPLQVGHATGSAKVHLGPGAISYVLKLRHRYGLSTRKSCELLEDCFGLPLSPGAVCQLEQRMAKKLLPDYEQLLQQARQAALIHSDETSWYVGQPGWWLWVLANDDLTLYEVSDRRDKATLKQLLGPSFDGILVSDCLSIYEHFCPRQQKCYAHHLKAISAALAACPQSDFLKQLRNLLQKAISYEACRDQFKPPDFKRLCSHLEKRTNQLLPVTEDEKGRFQFDEKNCLFSLQETELKVARRIATRRQHLFTFLYHEQVPATNNLAERQLRPAVIQRKVSCGNKTVKGANAWKVIRSLETTAHQNGQDFSNSVFQALQRSL
jgi:transposase